MHEMSDLKFPVEIKFVMMAAEAQMLSRVLRGVESNSSPQVLKYLAEAFQMSYDDPLDACFVSAEASLFIGEDVGEVFSSYVS